jgi:hypothetical protein
MSQKIGLKETIDLITEIKEEGQEDLNAIIETIEAENIIIAVGK